MFLFFLTDLGLKCGFVKYKGLIMVLRNTRVKIMVFFLRILEIQGFLAVFGGFGGFGKGGPLYFHFSLFKMLNCDLQ